MARAKAKTAPKAPSKKSTRKPRAVAPSSGGVAARIVAEHEARRAPKWHSVVLPASTSANNMFATRSRRPTPAYARWGNQAKLLILASRPPRLREKFEVRIEAGRNNRRDLDNYAKAPLDLLVAMGAVPDDRHCERVEISWADDLASNEMRLSWRAHRPPPAAQITRDAPVLGGDPAPIDVKHDAVASPPIIKCRTKTREETIGDCRLILGNSLEIMPTISGLHSIITDPVWPNVPADSIAGSDDPYGLWVSACGAMPEHKRLVVVMRCDSDPRFLQPCRGKFLRSIQLPYVMPGYLGRVLGGDETAYWFGDPIAVSPGRMVIPGRAPLVQPGGRKENGHPMSRAQAHFDWLVHWASDLDETVLDPFMGSGTTGVACVTTGRKFTGVEIEPKFFDIACRRIEVASRQPDLFVRKKKDAPAPDFLSALDGSTFTPETAPKLKSKRARAKPSAPAADANGFYVDKTEAGDQLTMVAPASLSEAREAYLRAFIADVRRHPDAYKASVRKNPIAPAQKMLSGLTVDEVRRLTRELAAENRRVERLTRPTPTQRVRVGRNRQRAAAKGKGRAR